MTKPRTDNRGGRHEIAIGGCVFRAEVPRILPAIMGSLCQEKAEGTLILEQNDGTRRLFWKDGQLIHLQSSVAGEQLGNYLLRQGVLDFPALEELLANEEQFRIGEKIVQWGLMSVNDRDLHLASLQEQVMINALEHDIIEMEWISGRTQLSEDLRFKLNHRLFIWATFQEAHNLGYLSDLLFAEPAWRWTAQPDLLDSLSDLPLTPQMAYSLSFLGVEPVGYETMLSLSGLNEEDAARLIFALWGLGGLVLTEGTLPASASKLLVRDPENRKPSAIPTAPNEPASLQSQEHQEPILTVPLDFLPKEPETNPASEQIKPPIEIQEDGRQSEEDASKESSLIRARKCLVKAKALLLQDRTVEAIRLLEECVRLDPDSDQAYEPWLLLGKNRLANPAWSTRSVEALQTASRLKPKAGEPWALMGELYRRKEFKANARACFKKALELDPSVPVPSDVNMKDDDDEPELRESRGILGRFKSMLGR